MIPFGALISLAGIAASGIKSAVNNSRAQEEADAEYQRRQTYYAGKAAEDPLARSESKRVLNQYDRDSERQVETARNVAAITGATPEYALAVQKGVAEGRANLMGNIAAGASERRDKYEALGEQARQDKATADRERRATRNETFGALAANAANAFGSIVSAYAPSGAGGTMPGTDNTPSAAATKTAEQSSYSEQNKKKNVTRMGVITDPNVGWG